MPKAVIFDMDGVLFLSSKAHQMAFNDVMMEIGLPNADYEDIAGMRTDEAFRKIFSDYDIEFDDEMIISTTIKKQAYVRKLLNDINLLAPGLHKCLEALACRYRLVIASSASSESIKIFLSLCDDAKRFFEFTLSGDTITKAKPDPEIYIKAAKLLSLEPQHCIVIEDSINGIRAAKAAGMQVIAMTGMHSYKLLSGEGVSGIVNNLDELRFLLCQE